LNFERSVLNLQRAMKSKEKRERERERERRQKEKGWGRLGEPRQPEKKEKK
jgi:hypothetical protein